jgi:hypothetical protein
MIMRPTAPQPHGGPGDPRGLVVGQVPLTRVGTGGKLLSVFGEVGRGFEVDGRLPLRGARSQFGSQRV